MARKAPKLHVVKITEELYHALEVVAAQEDRSVRSLVERTLRERYLKRKGGDQV